MRKKNVKWILVATLLCLCFGSFTVQAEGGTANRFNVVLVIDGSGSMKSTDPDGWRYEAIDEFLSLLSNSGNNVGAVVFNHDILQQLDLNDLQGMDGKKALSKSLKNTQVEGDTNIGKAVELAATMLTEQGNSSMQSAIILLSDGVTDFGSTGDKGGKKKKKAKQSRNNAIETCTQHGYPIYSVCLNKDGVNDTTEIADLAAATPGGIFMEINKAEDLKEVMEQFHAMIYGSSAQNLFDDKIPENGIIEKPFTIPVVGVEEANIIITNKKNLSEIVLTKPDGSVLSQADLNNIMMEGSTFTVIKLETPTPGAWMFSAKGVPGTYVKIDMVCNSNFGVDSEVENIKDSYIVGEDVNIRATLNVDGNTVKDKTVYATFEAKIILTNLATNESMEEQMQKLDDGYTYVYKSQTEGTFSAKVKVTSPEGNTKYGADMQISVGNGVPELTAETPIQITVKRSLFHREGTETYDLTGTATDPENGTVTYAITASDYMADVVKLEKEELQIDVAQAEKGVLTVTASDEAGASVQFQVEIKVKDSTLLMLIVLIVLLVVITVIALLLLIKIKNRQYKGDIMVLSFDTDRGYSGVPQTQSPLKGKYRLNQFVEDGCGINTSKSFFKPTGKKYIYFCTGGKGYFTERSQNKRVKKIEIKAYGETIISNQNDLASGIKVTFMPYDN